MTKNKSAPVILPAATASAPDTLQMMMEMQHQQMEMNKQFADIMRQFIPTTPASETTMIQSHRPNHTKIERPTIDADCTDNQWMVFCDSWSRYKEMASLTSVTEIRNELRSTCSSKINEMLFNFVGPNALNQASEDELMNYIKSVAVKAIHPEVYRQHFFTLRQSDCESITNFISRLKAQAMLCAFNSEGSCNQNDCSVSFSEDMVKSQLMAGLRNPTHQSKVLSEMEALKTSELVTTRLLALESTERASTHFRPTSEVAAVAHQQSRRDEGKRIEPPKPKNCSGCGNQIHPKSRSTCPAWNKYCRKCGKLNHFATVCRSPNKNASVSAATTVVESTPFVITSVQAESF